MDLIENLKSWWDNNNLNPNKHFGAETFNKIIEHYSEEHRHYHNLHHLFEVVNTCRVVCGPVNPDKENLLSKLNLAAFFHDVIYSPLAKDNEEQSVKFMLENLKIDFKELNDIKRIIMSSANHLLEQTAHDEIMFHYADCDILYTKGLTKLIEYEKKISKEFQAYPYALYKEKRIEFLYNFHRKNKNKLILDLIDYINSYSPKIGLYAGSFNPFHVGHLNILQQANNLFDKVIIAKGVNPEKKHLAVERPIPERLKFHEFIEYGCLLPHLIEKLEENYNITLIRGLRNGYDLNYETNQLRFMQEFYPAIKTVFIVCDKEYEHVSSSAIRNLEQFGAGLTKKHILI